MIKRILKEPITHFLVLGSLLFAAWNYLAPSQESENNEYVIVVDQAKFDHLKTLWKAQWKHEPSNEDIAAILERHIRKEVFYREALTMGLDQSDEIIRTRLAQKMEAVASDLSNLMQLPSEQQLKEFHQARPELFTIAQSFAFEQVILMPQEAQEPKLSEIRAQLIANPNTLNSFENRRSVPNNWPLMPENTLKNAFGGTFVEQLAKQPAEQWVGPIESGFGLHLVKIANNTPEHLAPFSDIKDYVLEQYKYYAVIDSQQKMFETLLKKYRVRLEADTIPTEIEQEFAAL
ncbi:peptidyl-prolyl cis-trans isomerase (plasmid) [Pseudoalteromonas lipolytica]|uniref:Peptidyl-prolyl cis-trans isomerase n=1 Tax=Pseudoalteromonas lipolytica TaxID=570156 RepID=A0AAD0WEE6_9GAMM|nr:peptidylprolyl isomerase [Pseudoalteromonas donghaensis]AXV67433.1 peptidyl-prolyl cis-trans isomerase [Pseudoalteromonas donghaensis]